MRSLRSDRRIVLGLIVALVFEIALLFWHMGIISWGTASPLSGEKIAGSIFKSNNELRRRSFNSLVWEKSVEAEPVYYFDSLLTLAQSAATLKLANNVEVELSENTLVTIEPQDESASGEIRLKFVRGNLQARNPFVNAKIQTSDFNVNLKPGSELQMRQTGEHEFEVQIKKGEAQVVSADGSHSVSTEGLLRISEGKAEMFALDSDLQWNTIPARRMYTHEDGADVLLTWKGIAQELRIQALGFNERVIPVKEDQRELRVRLPLGHHLAYLRSPAKTSTPVDMEVWSAPTLHLIMPLPRNRLRTEEVSHFLWTRIPEASAYEFHLKGRVLDLSEDSLANSFLTTFKEEDDGQWGVWAKDKEGYMIPPLYRYPIFIRHQPFAPPKLNSPRLRAPATKDAEGASLWRWLQDAVLPIAHADEIERFEALFSWQPVEGADRYWIEIAESADFRKLTVSKEVSKPEFVWREYQKRPYYWRVAAGSSSGRMGVFSEPELVTSSVEIRRVAPVAVVKPPAEKAPEPPPVAAKPVQAPIPEVKIHQARGWRLFSRPSVGMLQAKAQGSVRAELSGIKLFSLALEKDFLVSETRWWNVEAQYGRSTFKPEPRQDYPFQDDVILQHAHVSATRMRTDSVWGFGLSLTMLPEISRSGYEAIEAREKMALGVHARSIWSLDKVEYQIDISAKAGAGLYGVSTNQRLLRPIFNNRALIGIGTDAFYIFRGSYSTLSAEGFLLLGLEF